MSCLARSERAEALREQFNVLLGTFVKCAVALKGQFNDLPGSVRDW